MVRTPSPNCLSDGLFTPRAIAFVLILASFPARLPGVPLSSVPEMEVKASAGPGALADEFVIEKARWFLPEGMIRYDGDASPDDLRILRARGNSMEPELREGDRLVVDVAPLNDETSDPEEAHIVGKVLWTVRRECAAIPFESQPAGSVEVLKPEPLASTVRNAGE